MVVEVPKYGCFADAQFWLDAGLCYFDATAVPGIDEGRLVVAVQQRAFRCFTGSHVLILTWNPTQLMDRDQFRLIYKETRRVEEGRELYCWLFRKVGGSSDMRTKGRGRHSEKLMQAEYQILEQKFGF